MLSLHYSRRFIKYKFSLEVSRSSSFPQNIVGAKLARLQLSLKCVMPASVP